MITNDDERILSPLVAAGCGVALVLIVIACSGCSDPTARARERLETLQAATVDEVQSEPLDETIVAPDPPQCPCLNGGVCQCESSGFICRCGPRPSHVVFSNFDSPCVLKFTASWCGPCQGNKATVDPWLRDSGWTLHEVDVDGVPHVPVICEVSTLPTYVVIRQGYEVGRYTGIDKSEFLPILKRAVELKLSE